MWDLKGFIKPMNLKQYNIAGQMGQQDKPQFMMVKFHDVLVLMHRMCFDQYQFSSAVL